MKVKSIFFMVMTCLMMAGLGCGVGQAIQEMGEISVALNKEFEQEVTVGMNWNNGESSWTVSFTSLNMRNVEYDELGQQAEEVYNFLLDEFEKTEQQDFIIIRFTSEDEFDEESRDYAEFRYDQ